MVSLLLTGLISNLPWLSLADRTRDWLFYLAVGAVMPLALLISWKGGNTRFRTLFAVCWPIAGIVLLAVTWRWAAVPLALVQWWSLTRMAPHLVAEQETGAAIGAVALGSWVIVLSLQPIGEQGWRQMAAFLLVSLLATPLTMAWALDFQVTRFGQRFPWTFVGNTTAFAVLAVLSFRTDGLFSPIGDYGRLAWYHWGVFTGAADLVRQGGHLLWDVPAYYGFLDTLLLAQLPVESTWQGLYLLNAVLTFAAAAAIFLALRGRTRGLAGWLIGLSGAIIGCLLLKGFDTLVPEHLTPAVGGIRYVWCFVLVGILLWERTATDGSARQRLALATGLLAWLLGVFWSPESAAYCSIIWLPAYALITVRQTLESHPSRRARFWRAAAWLALPVLLFLGSLVGLGAIYQRTLGRLPDPIAYVDYVLGFGSGLVSAGYNEATNIDPVGTSLVAVLCFAAVLVLACDRQVFGDRKRDLPLLVALVGGIWGVSSYLVGRPYPTVVYRFLIFWLLAIGVSKLISSPIQDVGGRLFHRIMLAPVLVVIIASTLIDLPSLQANWKSLTSQAVSPLTIDDGIPAIDPSLASLLTEAGVHPDDPIQFAGDPTGGLMKAWRPAGGEEPATIGYQGWLPTMPLTAFSPLTDDRKTTYIERMSDRQHTGGWLIQRKENGAIDQGFRVAEQAGPWLFAAIGRDHVPTRVYENDGWQATWFAYMDPTTNFVAPEFPDGMLPALPHRIRVDGGSLADHPRGDVFAFWGPGWDIRPRRFQIPSVGLMVTRSEDLVSFKTSATLNIFSDEARTVSIAVEGTNIRDTLEIRKNGTVLGTMTPGAEGGSALTVDLIPGWNVLTLQHVNPARAARTIVTSIDIGVAPEFVAAGSRSSASSESETHSGDGSATRQNDKPTAGGDRARQETNQDAGTRPAARDSNVPSEKPQNRTAGDKQDQTRKTTASTTRSRTTEPGGIDRQAARASRQSRDDQRADPFQPIPPGPNTTVFETIEIESSYADVESTSP